MIRATLGEIAEATGGSLEGSGTETPVSSVSIDSRTLQPGALFVALEGSRDGHDFVPAALAAGASAALVARRYGGGAHPLVRVDDPATALSRLAEWARLRLRARVIAITGSSGKTITKDLTAAAVATGHRVVASPASFNNEIGVPLTILAADEQTEVIVAEAGSRGKGHLAALAPVLRHQVAVVTNVGLAHVGEFGSAAAIAQAKGELVEGLPDHGVAVLNADDPAVMGMAERTKALVRTFGTGAGAEVRAEGISLDEDALPSFVAVFVDERAPVSLRIPGEHMVLDALAAIAAAGAVGVPLAQAAAAVGTVAPARWRMQVSVAPGGWRVVNDAYNANPASVAAALRALVAMSRGRRTWAVLGAMEELGASTDSEHRAAGTLAAALGVSRVVAVGERARAIAEAAAEAGAEASVEPDLEAAARATLRALAPGDVVLVKASRAAGLDVLAERIAGAP